MVAEADLTRLLATQDYHAIEAMAGALCADAEDGFVLEQAIACKIADQPRAARRLLEALVAASPTYAAGHYELAVVCRNAKDLRSALLHAERAVQQAGHSFRFRLFFAHMLFAHGAWAEGQAQIGLATPNDDADRLEQRAIGEFGDYLKEFPRSRALLMTERLRRTYHWMNVAEVAAAIETAIAAQAPFALIRLGDGDGAHFRVNEENERRFANLHLFTRKAHTEFLLGADVDPVFTGYTGLISSLAATVCEADILGIAYPSWVEHEYDISSPITLNCLMNINRYFYENETISGLCLCDQLIHMQLHEARLLEPIIASLSEVTLISCLDGLPDRMREKFRLKNVAFIKIPSETYAPHLFGEHKLRQSLHFPHAFWPTVQRLSVPHEGRVFLIAAGTFGKYYAAIIKRHGGIALDIGSLVDVWMKLASRPGYERFIKEEV